MKDLKMLAGVLAIMVIIVPAAWGVFAKSWDHKDTQIHLAELTKEFKIDQYDRAIQRTDERIWQLEDRLQFNPKDGDAALDLKKSKAEKERLEFKKNQLEREIK